MAFSVLHLSSDELTKNVGQKIIRYGIDLAAEILVDHAISFEKLHSDAVSTDALEVSSHGNNSQLARSLV